MVLIAGEIFLITLPIFVFVMRRDFFLKKYMLIIVEVLLIGILLFVSCLIALDIPYMLKGGEKCEEQVTYAYATQDKGFNIATVETSDGKVYWALDGGRYSAPTWINVLSYGNKSDANLYVLPHTRLVCRVENTFNSMKDTDAFQFLSQYANKELYSMYSMNWSVGFLLVLEGIMLYVMFKEGV